MKVLFVLPRMVSGGVERVTLNLIGEFTRAGIECRLALRRSHGELLGEARSLVSVDELAPRGLHQFVPALARRIKTWQPTHVITAFTDIAALTWLALRLARSTAHWIHGVHNTHALVTSQPGTWGRLRYELDNQLAKFVYRRADTIVAVSEGLRLELITRFNTDPARTIRIYNPVIPDSELRDVTEPRHSLSQGTHIVALGRLTRQKGFDILIRAMAEVPLPWRLDIWGEGPERSNLEKLIARLKLESAVYLQGYTSNPFTVLRQADLFVLPSRYEGLPTALIEAVACQCQIIATDCPHGPREILQNGQIGQLVPPEAPSVLASAIRDAAAGSCHDNPKDLQQRAKDFSLAASSEKWYEILGATMPVVNITAI